MTADLSDHVERRMKEAELRLAPFPHFVMDAFLPHDLFGALLASYPSSEDFGEARLSSQSRYNLMFEDAGYLRLVRQSSCWATLHEFLTSRCYIDLVLSKFAGELLRHGAVLETSDRLRTKFDIAWAGAGYTRSCHLDRRNHAVASLLYFNARSDYGGSGGDLQLYSSSLTPPFDKFPPPEKISLASSVEPAANRFVAFLNTSNAYHGISAMKDSTSERKFLYVSIDNHSRDDMWPEVVVADEARRQSFIAE